MFKNIEPGVCFITGIAIILPFLFTDDLIMRSIFVVIAIILNISTGRKIRILPNILLLLGIIIANIYPPVGKVYFEIGNFYITEGAITSGIKKFLLLIGTVYISRFAVRKELIFPGKTGFLFYKIFFYFEKLTELRLEFRNNIINQIDSKLFEIEKSITPDKTDNVKNHSFNIKPDFKQVMFFIIINLLFWGLFLYQVLACGGGVPPSHFSISLLVISLPYTR